jgi:hypothetical protein
MQSAMLSMTQSSMPSALQSIGDITNGIQLPDDLQGLNGIAACLFDSFAIVMYRSAEMPSSGLCRTTSCNGMHIDTSTACDYTRTRKI